MRNLEEKAIEHDYHYAIVGNYPTKTYDIEDCIDSILNECPAQRKSQIRFIEYDLEKMQIIKRNCEKYNVQLELILDMLDCGEDYYEDINA